MSVLLVVAILVLLIVAHELGHFAVAKWVRVKVEEFGIGYPPRLARMGKIGETEYTLNWLPFGGFVRLFGEDKPDGPRSFASASKGAQALILVAGVVANVFVAWLLFAGAFMLGLPTAVADDTPGARLLISGIVPNSPAAESALMVGDEILSVLADDGTGASNLTPVGVSEYISQHGGNVLTITYMREGEHDTVDIIPAHAILPDEEGRPAVGIALTPIAEKKLSFFPALIEAGSHTGHSLVAVTVGLYNLAKDAIVSEARIENLVGPVGLVDVVGDAAGHGFGQLLGLAAFISINLAIINLLPIPALDGGRLVIVGIEAASRKRVPHAVVSIVNTLGFLLIIFLMLAVTYNDVLRLVS